MRRYGFFEYATAPRTYDKEKRTLSRYASWLRIISYLQIFIIICLLEY
jgi:hypothetical protein